MADKSIVSKKIPYQGAVDTKGIDKTPIEASVFPFPNSLDLSKDVARIKKGRGGDLGSNSRVPAQYVGGYNDIKPYSKVVKKNP
jgi:hypothetical protein